jgi:hypothetical protein
MSWVSGVDHLNKFSIQLTTFSQKENNIIKPATIEIKTPVIKGCLAKKFFGGGVEFLL